MDLLDCPHVTMYIVHIDWYTLLFIHLSDDGVWVYGVLLLKTIYTNLKAGDVLQSHEEISDDDGF